MTRARLRSLFGAGSAGVVLGAGLVLALRPAARPPSASGTAAAEHTLAPAELALDRRVPEVWLVNVPLDAAARRVGELAGLPVEVDAKAFAAAGASATRPVTVRVRNAVLADVLDEVVASYQLPVPYVGSAAPPITRIGWHVRPHGVALAPDQVAPAPAPVVVRTYDVRDLLGVKLPEPDMATDAVWSPTAGQELAELLPIMIAPDTWWESGGTVGRAHQLGGRLIVTQTLAHHRQIRMLLAQFRTKPAPVPLPVDPAGPESDVFRWHAGLCRWVSNSPARTEAKLRAVLPEFRAEHLPVREAVRRLAAAADVPVAFHVPAGANDDGWTDRPVAVRARSAEVQDMLRVVLEAAAAPASPDPRLRRIDWYLDGEVLVIGLREDMDGYDLRDRIRVTRVHDVRDLLAAAAAVTQPAGPTTGAAGAAPLAPADRLIHALTQSVDPETWRDAGGSLGTIRETGGQLVVTQSRENHEKIARLLDDLRRGGRPATRPAGDANEGQQP